MQAAEIGAGTITIRLPNWVGDAVMATPALRALRRAAPRARLLAIGPPPIGRLLAGLRTFDEFVSFDRRGRHRGWRGFLRMSGELRRAKARLAIVLPHSFGSALLARASGAECVLGYHTHERALLLHEKPRPRMDGARRLPIPMTRLYLELLRAVGVESRDERLELAVSDDEESRADAELERLGVDAGEPYFAANPGASFGASKFWTVDGFAATIRGLHERHGLRTLVLCGPGEQLLARAISAAAGSAAVDTSHAPIALELLKPLLRRARLLLTTDTGPRHIATAFGVPTIVLMGPTDPRHTASNLEVTRVLRVDVECGPCHLKVCPLDHRCMLSLTADQALRAADELLQQTAVPQGAPLHA